MNELPIVKQGSCFAIRTFEIIRGSRTMSFQHAFEILLENSQPTNQQYRSISMGTKLTKLKIAQSIQIIRESLCTNV